MDVLIVNDASEDETIAIVPGLGVLWLDLPVHLGVGGAVRAGLRYAHESGYDLVVRIDADGQHRPQDVDRLAAPVLAGDADVAVGTRHVRGFSGPGRLKRFFQWLLGTWLGVLSGHRITDPTSGFWVFGREAIAFLAEHHPSGYPEPELMLLLGRERIRLTEVAVEMRHRVAGESSLTYPKIGMALACTLVASVVVPLRARQRVTILAEAPALSSPRA